ncbi:MAG: hypothetical protein IJS00_06325 [Paludibacteraceae bacterium]|nr:hypothetical protein [Paludibacteraceae bacterium]
MTNTDMNLWDVCVLFWNKLANCCRQAIDLLCSMLRLTYRLLWVVGIVMALSVALAVYYTRQDNRWYRVRAIVTLNGPTTNEAKNYYERLNNSFSPSYLEEQSLSLQLGIKADDCRYLGGFHTAYVVDNLDDGTADFVDWQHRNDGTDSVNVRMRDQLGLEFVCSKLSLVPEVEEAVMKYLNSQEQFQAQFVQYTQHTKRQHLFDSVQVNRLDTLTSRMYAQAGALQMQSNAWNLTMGKQSIELPLGDIDHFMDKKLRRDARSTLSTAPIVLQGRFTAQNRPINSRSKWLVVALLLGWIAGCIVAYGIEQRKQIHHYLKS